MIDDWWQTFEDPVLVSLVDRAVRANHDLKLAQSRVREARARYGFAQADRWPRVDAGGTVARERQSENGPFPAPADPEHGFFAAGFDASWEIDVFGGLKREAEAAGADLEASVEGRRATLVTLLGDVARAYVETRGAQGQLAALRSNVASASATLDLTRTRAAAGLATELDVVRAEAQLKTTESAVPPREAALRHAMYRLAVLLGEPPGALVAELSAVRPVPAPLPMTLVGIPAELLRRRPDLRQRERELAAAYARIGVATADLYPRFSLTGSFGLESVDAGDFFEPASRAWAIGPSIRWAVLDFGRIRAGIEVAGARAEQAQIAYEQALLVALEEVEDALVSYLREWERHETLSAALRADRTAVDLAKDLYRGGLATFLDVLDAERELYEAQRLLAESDAERAIDLVALYKALGGGWRTVEEGAE